MLRPLLLYTLRLSKPAHVETLTDTFQEFRLYGGVRIEGVVWVLDGRDLGGGRAAG